MRKLHNIAKQYFNSYLRVLILDVWPVVEMILVAMACRLWSQYAAHQQTCCNRCNHTLRSKKYSMSSQPTCEDLSLLWQRASGQQRCPAVSKIKYLKQASSKQRCHDLVQVIVKLAAVKSIKIWASGTWSSTTRSTTWNPWWAVIQGEMTFCCLARALMPPKTSRSSSIQRRLWVGWGLQAGCDPVGICILESCIWVLGFHFHSADTVIGWVAQEQGVNRGPLWWVVMLCARRECSEIVICWWGSWCLQKPLTGQQKQRLRRSWERTQMGSDAIW